MEKINETAKILVNDSCIYFNNDVFKEVVKYDPKNNDKNLFFSFNWPQKQNNNQVKVAV